MKPRRSLRSVYGIPALLALVTSCGLLSALLGDGLWDALSWIALAIPLAVLAWYLVQGRRRSRVG